MSKRIADLSPAQLQQGIMGEWNKTGAGVGSAPNAHPIGTRIALDPLDRKAQAKEGKPTTLSPRFVPLSLEWLFLPIPSKSSELAYCRGLTTVRRPRRCRLKMPSAPKR
jgi:hypothetical protein